MLKNSLFLENVKAFKRIKDRIAFSIKTIVYSRKINLKPFAILALGKNRTNFLLAWFNVNDNLSDLNDFFF